MFKKQTQQHTKNTQGGHVPPVPTQAGQASRYNSGQAIIIAVLFFLVGSFIIVTGVSAPVLREIALVRTLTDSKQSFFIAEGGAEDAMYRLKNGLFLSSPEVITLGDSTATVTNTPVSIDEIEIISTGDTNERIRTTQALLVEGIGVSFFYGVHADTGGIQMFNQAAILGNIFSDGSLIGSGSNLIDGDAFTSGPDGLISGVHATGTARSHNIQDSIIDGDAYYGCEGCISNTTVGGTREWDIVDLAPGNLPITEAWIDSWEADAEAGGVITSADPRCNGGTYDISSDTALGPVKIECDLVIRSVGTIFTIGGTIWVVGDIEFRNSPTITTDLALGPKSVTMIADNPADRVTSSKIRTRNSFFADHSFEGSHILLLSRNNDAKENMGSNLAIDVEQNAEGDFLVYANKGAIRLRNSATLSEVSAFNIILQNKAKVVYETGLKNLLFTAGPSGGYVVQAWGEI